MKKILLVFIAILSFTCLFAQDAAKPNTTSKIINHASDHFMIQLSSDHWQGITDTIKSHTTGLPRGLGIYVMVDKPFKTNPHYSIAFGLGVGSSNIYFKASTIGINATSTTIPFTALDSTTHFKKYKLSTTYVEVPVELRFVDKPLQNNKSFKAAIGVKIGTLLNAHTKGKTLVSNTGGVINNYTEKESDKHFFNSTKFAATARVGYGNFSLYGSYQITSLFKDGQGPLLHPFQIGFCISGL